MKSPIPISLLRAPLLAAMALAWSAPLAAFGQNVITLANPQWNITLTDFGYSDFLLDNTPGFEGREYLSGEWAAAIGYRVGDEPVAPIWLEPSFVYPNWSTNSNFTVVTPAAQTGLNSDGLPIAESVIRNAHVEIRLRFEMLDTVVGTPMGTKPASMAGTATYLLSNRYVMKQTATIKNIAATAITDLQLFQFLHGLSSQRGLYDNRPHPGQLGEFHHDTTLAGLDPWSAGPSSSSIGLEDYIAMHAMGAPSGHEVGYYGVEGNGVDDHFNGMPSEGVHRSVAANWGTAPFAARLGTDSFEPPQRWVAGAQRWNLTDLAPGQSVSMDVLLSILTGTRVTQGPGSTGACNGGSGVPGGLHYEFEDVDAPGSCFANFSRADDAEIEIRVSRGEFDHLTFPTPGKPVQVWETEFDGAYSGAVSLVFGYDPTLLPPLFDEATLAIYHFAGGIWQKLPSTVNSTAHTITVASTTFGAFALGVGSATTYTIAAASAPIGAGTISGGGSFPAGSGVVLEAVPAPGYAFVNWTENGAPVASSPSFNFNVSGNRSLVANFTVHGADKSITTVSAPANGGTTAGGGVYGLNAAVTVSATPAVGYKFSKWTESGVVVSTSPNYTFVVNAHRSLEARFKPVYVINVAAQPSAGGEIEVDAAYEMGELAKLKAAPAEGYCFVNWTQNGVALSTAEQFHFNVTGNRDLVANFALGHRIDVFAEPKNAGSASGGGVYASNDTVHLVAQPNFGYIFTNWTDAADQTIVGTTAAITITGATNRVLQANFIALPPITPASNALSGLQTFSWPAAAAGWVLQESANLAPGSWVNSTRAVTIVNGQKQVAAPAGGSLFFRLIKP